VNANTAFCLRLIMVVVFQAWLDWTNPRLDHYFGFISAFLWRKVHCWNVNKCFTIWSAIKIIIKIIMYSAILQRYMSRTVFVIYGHIASDHPWGSYWKHSISVVDKMHKIVRPMLCIRPAVCIRNEILCIRPAVCRHTEAMHKHFRRLLLQFRKTPPLTVPAMCYN